MGWAIKGEDSGSFGESGGLGLGALHHRMVWACLSYGKLKDFRQLGHSPNFQIHMRISQILLVPVVCLLFLLGGQRVAAQSKENDVLVMEFGFEGAIGAKTYGMYIFWPDKEVEFISMQIHSKPEEAVANKKLLFRKINELVDLGWELYIVDNVTPIAAYYFRRAAAK